MFEKTDDMSIVTRLLNGGFVVGLPKPTQLPGLFTLVIQRGGLQDCGGKTLIVYSQCAPVFELLETTCEATAGAVVRYLINSGFSPLSEER